MPTSIVYQLNTCMFGLQEIGRVKGVSHQLKTDFFGTTWRKLEKTSKPLWTYKTKSASEKNCLLMQCRRLENQTTHHVSSATLSVVVS